jgi:hypothetical protein
MKTTTQTVTPEQAAAWLHPETNTDIMRAHLHGQSLERVYEAAEDMMGNKNTSRLIEARSQRSLKAAATRYQKGA